MNIKELIKQEESENLEFKSSLSDVNRIIEEIAGFANTSGGCLVIGVDEKGEVKGIGIGKNTIESLSNKITDNTDPRIYPKISVQEIGSKKIILIEAKRSKNRPCLAFGKAFKRVGNVTKSMSRDEYGRMSNKEYRGLFPGITDKTAYRDLQDMVEKGLIKPMGELKGRHYVRA